ncbi:hypothetical protein KPL70_007356 [Citrus sinensis]|nr:hypothetical protein KPL70_007356 [Citrus sinensis]
MEAKLGSNPCFIWRISDLIDSDHHWNLRLIDQHFAKEDAEAIKKIPLPRYPQDDELIWHHDKKGQYIVRSGYQVTLGLKLGETPTSSTGGSHGWFMIWNLNLPRKIKIFTWRATKNLLPTLENLSKRKILEEPVCLICKMGIEDVFHALMGCKMVKKVWKCTHVNAIVQDVGREDMLSVMLSLVRKMPKREFIFEGRTLNPLMIIAKANAIIEAYQGMHGMKQISKSGNETIKQDQWRPPPSGHYKINVDAAVHIEQQLTRLGAVIRNSKGQVIGAAVRSTSFQEDVTAATAEAVKLGMEMAKEARLMDVIVETDCIGVVNLANNETSNRKEILWTISEIQECKAGFQSIQIQYVPRCCNKFAHSLAKRALKSSESVRWLETPQTDVLTCFSFY